MTDEPNPSNETQSRVIKWDVNKAAIAEVAEELKDIDAYKDLPAAKEAKSKLTKMRSKLTEYHKETKAEALAFGKECDAQKNDLMLAIRVIEDPISEDLTAIKNAATIAEEGRVANIMAEIERIQAYALDRHSLTLEEMNERLANLREQEMDPELIEEYFDDWGMANQEADLKLRLAIDAETTRLKEVEAAAKMEAENQGLRDLLAKAEAEEAERNRVAAEEQAEKDAEYALVRAEERAIQEAYDKRRKAELDAQQAEIDAEKKRVRDENEAQAEADAKAKADEDAAKLAALQAPDIEKLQLYADAIEHLIGLRPVMGSTAGNSALLDTVALLVDSHDIVKKHIEELK